MRRWGVVVSAAHAAARHLLTVVTEVVLDGGGGRQVVVVVLGIIIVPRRGRLILMFRMRIEIVWVTTIVAPVISVIYSVIITLKKIEKMFLFY
jgi:hypothetical protein